MQRYFSNDIADTKHWHTYRLCNPTSDGCDLSPVHRQCWTYGRARSPGTASSPIPLWWVQRLGIQQQQPAVPVEYIRKGYDKQRAQPLNVFQTVARRIVEVMPNPFHTVESLRQLREV